MASVLLVEGEVLIRIMVADMVTELGHTVAAEAGDLPSALELANNADFDVAVLDVQLGRDGIEPLARALAHRNIPFAFASGYGADGLLEEFRGRPWLPKAFSDRGAGTLHCSIIALKKTSKLRRRSFC